MNIWNKVLLVLIALLGIFATLWSAKELKVQSRWGEAVRKLDVATLKAQADSFRLQTKADELPALEVREYRYLLDHAENWRNCKPKAFENAGGTAKIVFTVETKNIGIMNAADTIYVFDTRKVDDGGGFLGRFTVTAVEDTEMSAESLDLLNDQELLHIEKSLEDQATWSIHTKCPADRPEFFRELSAVDRSKHLSPELSELYSGTEYQPVDFGYVLSFLYQKRVENRERLASALSHQQALAESQKIASAQLQFYQNEMDRLKEEISLKEADRDEVGRLSQALEKEISNMSKQIRQTQAENEKLEEEIKRMQTEALRKSSSTTSTDSQTRNF